MRERDVQCRPNCFALSYAACSILTATPPPASCFLITSLTLWLISSDELHSHHRQRGTERGEGGYAHFPEVDDLLLLRLRIRSDDTERRTDTERSLDDVASNDDGCNTLVSNDLEEGGKRDSRSRLAKQAIILSLHGQTALGALSTLLASTIWALYAVNASKRW
jgi:hypothetical protein